MIVNHSNTSTDVFFVELGLSRDEMSGQWFADKLTLNLGEALNRISFYRPLPLQQAFIAPFVQALERFLPKGYEQAIFADSKTIIELPDLVIGGLRVIAHNVKLGVQRVTVRFKRAFGTVQSFLLPEHRSDRSNDIALEKTAADALLTLLQPCLDLASVDSDLAESEQARLLVAHRLRALAEKKSEISFFSHMLQRFILRSENRAEWMRAEAELAQLGSGGAANAPRTRQLVSRDS